jgi:hypothetical protein
MPQKTNTPLVILIFFRDIFVCFGRFCHENFTQLMTRQRRCQQQMLNRTPAEDPTSDSTAASCFKLQTPPTPSPRLPHPNVAPPSSHPRTDLLDNVSSPLQLSSPTVQAANHLAYVQHHLTFPQDRSRPRSCARDGAARGGGGGGGGARGGVLAGAEARRGRAARGRRGRGGLPAGGRGPGGRGRARREPRRGCAPAREVCGRGAAGGGAGRGARGGAGAEDRRLAALRRRARRASRHRPCPPGIDQYPNS